MNKKAKFVQILCAAAVLTAICVMPLQQTQAATGSLSASTKYVYIPSGLGSVTLTFSSSGCGTAQVYVNLDNTYDKLMAENTSGTCNIGWIVPGVSYTFRLYANTDRTELLDAVTVVGYGPNSGTIGIRESEVIIPSGLSLGTAEITYGTNGYATAQVYVKMDNNAEQLWSQSTTGCGTASWIQDGHKYQFKLYSGTSHTNLLDSVTLYGRKYEYGVGSNYHATGSDFNTTAFLRNYHITATRNTVLAQLQGMANAGATHVRMSLYPTVTSGTPTETWKLHFPLSAQEITNLHQYAVDVAGIVASGDGHRLFLDIEFYWTWAASYQVGTPTTTIGNENLSPTTYKNYVEQSYEDVVDAVYNVYRGDGKKVVTSICFDNETMSCKTNTLWFFGGDADKYDGVHYCSGLYEGFVTYCINHGITVGLELNKAFNNMDIVVMNPNYTDGSYPVLNGHGAMYWPCRLISLFNDHNIYIPARIDFSMYPPGDAGYTYSQIFKKVFDDADAVLPQLGVRKYYRLTEMFYLNDDEDRDELGDAICEERLRLNRVTGVEFWNTPYNSGWPTPTCYPFDFADYLP